VWFLFKCLLVLAVIFFMASRDQPLQAPTAAKTKVETSRRAPSARHDGDSIETLKKAAAQKLADGVKEQCLKRPEDCLAVAKTVGAGLSALDKGR